MFQRTLIIGSNGQLGKALTRLIPSSVNASRKTGSEVFVDLSDVSTIEPMIERLRPEVIINAAAMTGVDSCEKKKSEALMINGYSLRTLTRAARMVDSKLVHASTDYVFDGGAGNFSEEDIPNPINYYGLSKLIGDTYVDSYERSLIVRTSGVYGYANNFPMFVYKQLKTRNPVNAIDGYYSPIHAANLAKAIIELVRKEIYGLINVSGDRISRYALSRKIAEEFGFDRNLCTEVGSMGNMQAKRPFDSSLDISKAKKLLSFDFSSIESNLKKFRESVEELGV